ncbi:alpha/beta hydrolase fold protein [Roseibium sp. TrichSKD4]|uniref:alpha/beta fold hydrolase n=1 Tax=Roseibium sp. TrichSKD4 TaxID=744980 RepID=UPI0001E5698F|nr:alpha/beta hydrolase [Roseibium sp. TrichSKD4]EFO30618.1 alpha/beta hydrolase fold protein [Roseibium sp. TrichSKD4]
MNRTTVTFTGAEGNALIADQVGENGRPVLLLHGGGQTRHSWDAAAERIAALGHVVYCMDQRGHGESEWVPSGNYNFHDFGKDLVEVSRQIKERNGARPVLVGASLGGLAGILSEGTFEPGVLFALVLVDITPRMDMGGVQKIVGFMAKKLEDGFGSVEEAADAIASYIPNRTRPKNLSGLSKNLRLHDDGRYRWHWDPKFIKGSKRVNPDDRQLVQDELVAAAAKLKLPVLLVRGRNSELVSQEYVDEFLQLVPHAKFVDIKDAGHMVAGDKNDVFAEAVETFLTDLFANV